MLRSMAPLSAALAVAMCAGTLGAEELKSGLAVGQSVGFFQVVKCGGAPKDGVSVGDTLCYR
jgi:hypothetical protein